MPKQKLTDAFVKSASAIKNKLTEYSDEKERGLCLRVTPTGIKSWTFRYRTKEGKQQRLSIGKLDDISLADARKRIIAHRAMVADGGDPVLEITLQKEKAQEAIGCETVKDIGDWYFKECRVGRHKPNAKGPKRESTLRTEQLYFDKQIVPRLGKRKLVDLTRASVQSFVNDLADNQSKSAARHCRVILHGIFAFAQRQDITDKANPCQHVTTAAHSARERVLTDRELKIIWQTLMPPINLQGVSVSANVAYSILLAMVTLQRRAEITGMSIDEIDRVKRIWVIPGNRTKNHQGHVVPLSDLALELIDKAIAIRPKDSAYVFPSPRGENNSINPQALTRAFIRMREALGLKDMRPHDLRITGATNMTGEELGISRFIVSKVLNHTSDTGNSAAVTSIYDQNEYLSDKRKALNAWAEKLLIIVTDS